MKKMGRMNLMKMCELLEMKHFRKGEEIEFKYNDWNVVFFLKAGTIKIVSKSTNHTTHLVKKGNIFGELSLFSELVPDEKAVALEDVTLCYIPTDQMRILLDKHPSLKNGVLKLNGIRIRKLQNRLEDLLYKDSQTRIKEYIINYAIEFGEKVNGKYEVKNLISHSDIAHLTNTSRQTVSNVMSSLRKRGVIDYDTKKIKLLNTK
jgi:CRP/FNR family transcriptional regulator